MSGETVVLQSAPDAGRPAWIEMCLDSVRGWAEARGFAYRRCGDELFDRVPADLRAKIEGRPMVAADLARLAWLEETLRAGAQRALWLDADVLVFKPDGLDLPEEPYAFGREQWVQRDERGRPKAYARVHNAFALFSRGEADGLGPILPFLRHASERLVRRYRGTPPPHLVGPKLLGVLHNLLALPVVDTVGSLSPHVLADLRRGEGEALELLRWRTKQRLVAANLCASLTGRDYEGVTLTDAQMVDLCRGLLADRGAALIPR
jgi:hypothetical protein